MTNDIHYAEGETYLIVSAKQSPYGPRGRMTLQSFYTRKTKPDVARDEIAIKLKLRLPASLFVRPVLAAEIGIEGDVPTIDLSPETVSSIQDVIRAQSGLDIQLTVVGKEED